MNRKKMNRRGIKAAVKDDGNQERKKNTEKSTVNEERKKND